MTTSHVDPTHDAPSGGLLLPVFTIAFLIAMVPIVAVVASPSIVTLVIAMATVIGFAGGLIVYLSRMIGPDEH